MQGSGHIELVPELNITNSSMDDMEEQEVKSYSPEEDDIFYQLTADPNKQVTMATQDYVILKLKGQTPGIVFRSKTGYRIHILVFNLKKKRKKS